MNLHYFFTVVLACFFVCSVDGFCKPVVYGRNVPKQNRKTPVSFSNARTRPLFITIPDGFYDLTWVDIFKLFLVENGTNVFVLITVVFYLLNSMKSEVNTKIDAATKEANANFEKTNLKIDTVLGQFKSTLDTQDQSIENQNKAIEIQDKEIALALNEIRNP